MVFTSIFVIKIYQNRSSGSSTDNLLAPGVFFVILDFPDTLSSVLLLATGAFEAAADLVTTVFVLALKGRGRGYSSVS